MGLPSMRFGRPFSFHGRTSNLLTRRSECMLKLKGMLGIKPTSSNQNNNKEPIKYGRMPNGIVVEKSNMTEKEFIKQVNLINQRDDLLRQQEEIAKHNQKLIAEKKALQEQRNQNNREIDACKTLIGCNAQLKQVQLDKITMETEKAKSNAKMSVIDDEIAALEAEIEAEEAAEKAKIAERDAKKSAASDDTTTTKD
jgi:hypothetical protein